MPALVINVGSEEALDEAIARYIKRKYDITIAAHCRRNQTLDVKRDAAR